MARKVFFSFKYDDVSRSMIVRNSRVIGGDEKAGFIDHADFEKIERQGDAAQLGRTVAGANVDQRECQADCGDHDPHRVSLRYGLGNVGSGWRSDHCAGCHRDLVCPQLHRQGVCDGTRVMPCQVPITTE